MFLTCRNPFSLEKFSGVQSEIPVLSAFDHLRKMVKPGKGLGSGL